MDIVLREVPADILKVIQEEQAKEKKNRGTNQYSLSSTIIKIIREWKNKCRE
jgi:hypothetical protein